MRSRHSSGFTHASALIAAGLDIVTISRRFGHGTPEITLGIYAQKFKNTDDAAARAIDAAMGADRAGCQSGARSLFLFLPPVC